EVANTTSLCGHGLTWMRRRTLRSVLAFTVVLSLALIVPLLADLRGISVSGSRPQVSGATSQVSASAGPRSLRLADSRMSVLQRGNSDVSSADSSLPRVGSSDCAYEPVRGFGLVWADGAPVQIGVPSQIRIVSI